MYFIYCHTQSFVYFFFFFLIGLVYKCNFLMQRSFRNGKTTESHYSNKCSFPKVINDNLKSSSVQIADLNDW